MFSSSLKFKKSVVITLVFCLIFSGLFIPNTKKVEATGIPVVDALGNAISAATRYLMSQTVGGTSPLMLVAAKAGKIAIKRLLRQMTQSIVNWIDSGFKGNPSFITNTDQFLRDTADIAIGDMLIGTDLEFLCDPFKIQVKLALGLQYRPFQEQIRCSFSSVLGNMEDAMNNFMNGDFIGGGGWDTWLQITTVPQNNQMGAMIIAQNELDARIETSKGNAILEANWGNGFLSWKECKDVPQEGDENFTGPVQPGVRAARENFVGPVKPVQECTIQTPGKEIVEQLGWANSSQMRELELAQDLDAIMGALANQVLTGGLNLLKSTVLGSKAQGKSPYQKNMEYLATLQTQLQNNQSFSGNIYGNYNNDGTVNRAAALENINTQLAVENQYFVAQGNIFDLLDATKNLFASASACDSTIQLNVLNQIEGNTTYDKTVFGNLPWNKSDIMTASSNASANVTSLTEAKTIISNPNSTDSIIEEINQELSLLYTNTANDVISFSNGGTNLEKIKTWIRTKLAYYRNNPNCVLNTGTLSVWGIE